MVVGFKSTAMLNYGSVLESTTLQYSRCCTDTKAVSTMDQKQVDNQTTLAHAGGPPWLCNPRRLSTIVHINGCSISLLSYIPIFTGRNKVVAKVIFLHLSVILFTGGGVCLSACWDTTPPKSRHPPPGKQTPAYGQ